MSKPTENQIKLTEFIHKQVGHWIVTNDIDSPTHGSDLEEDIDVHLVSEGLIRPEHGEHLEDALDNILYIIRSNK